MKSLPILIIAIIFFVSFIFSKPLSSGEEDEENYTVGNDLIYGKHFQGDMVLTGAQKRMFEAGADVQHTGVRGDRYKWKKDLEIGKVIVPYTFRDSSGYTPEEVKIVREALDEIEEKTCIKFVQKTNQGDYIEVFNGDGCFSGVGKQGGKQDLSLKRQIYPSHCMHHKTVMHEFIHALGYTHMQNHEDRDDFVKIDLTYVDEDNKNNFYKVSAATHDNYGTPYDYESVMHYSRNAFGNGHDSMIPTNKKYLNIIGNVKHLSSGDVIRLQKMYDCKPEAIGKNRVAPEADTTPNPNDSEIERQLDALSGGDRDLKKIHEANAKLISVAVEDEIENIKKQIGNPRVFEKYEHIANLMNPHRTMEIITKVPASTTEAISFDAEELDFESEVDRLAGGDEDNKRIIESNVKMIAGLSADKLAQARATYANKDQFDEFVRLAKIYNTSKATTTQATVSDEDYYEEQINALSGGNAENKRNTELNIETFSRASEAELQNYKEQLKDDALFEKYLRLSKIYKARNQATTEIVKTTTTEAPRPVVDDYEAEINALSGGNPGKKLTIQTNVIMFSTASEAALQNYKEQLKDDALFEKYLHLSKLYKAKNPTVETTTIAPRFDDTEKDYETLLNELTGGDAEKKRILDKNVKVIASAESETELNAYKARINNDALFNTYLRLAKVYKKSSPNVTTSTNTHETLEGLLKSIKDPELRRIIESQIGSFGTSGGTTKITYHIKYLK